MKLKHQHQQIPTATSITSLTTVTVAAVAAPIAVAAPTGPVASGCAHRGPFDQEKANSSALQAKLDGIIHELGERILKVFNHDLTYSRRATSTRRGIGFVRMHCSYFMTSSSVDREITARYIALINRADPDMLRYMQYNVDHVDSSKGDTYKLAKEFGQQLIDNTWELAGKTLVYKDGKLECGSNACITLML
jgi:hypothetical protein